MTTMGIARSLTPKRVSILQSAHRRELGHDSIFREREMAAVGKGSTPEAESILHWRVKVRGEPVDVFVHEELIH